MPPLYMVSVSPDAHTLWFPERSLQGGAASLLLQGHRACVVQHVAKLVDNNLEDKQTVAEATTDQSFEQVRPGSGLFVTQSSARQHGLSIQEEGGHTHVKKSRRERAGDSLTREFMKKLPDDLRKELEDMDVE